MFFDRFFKALGVEQRIERCTHGDWLEFIIEGEGGDKYVECQRCRKIWERWEDAVNEAEDRGYVFN